VVRQQIRLTHTVKEPHISEHKESDVGCSELGAEQHNAKKSARVSVPERIRLSPMSFDEILEELPKLTREEKKQLRELLDSELS
jgi:hypothetical protein